MSRWEWVMLFFGSFVLTFLIGFYFWNWGLFYRGLNQMKNQNYGQARKHFLEILSKNFNNSPARLNLALIESLQKNFENALGEYGIVSKESKVPRERFQSYFNSGHLKSQMNDVESSLDFYQKALEENSDSIEVKTNIELMMMAQDSKNSQSEDKDEDEKHESSDSSEDMDSSKKSMKEDSLQEDSQKSMSEETISQGELSSDQVQFIIKEIEKKEQELKKRLNQQLEDSQPQGRQW